MNKFLKNLNTFTSKELITVVYAESKTVAMGEAKINPNANYSYTISSKLALKYFEKDDDYSFNYTKAEVKLLEVTDENNAVLKVTPKEREMIENFFSTKLIFDIKKNF